MASWLDRLRNPFASKAAPGLSLGAFGKHPGWSDHIEDIGLDTEALLAARQFLYVQGIGGAIDGALWDSLPPEQSLSEFDHAFVWLCGDDCLPGRLWASRDGKGRTRYPMVVCAHAACLPARAVLDCAEPALERLEAKCRAADSASSVQAILESERAILRNALDTRIATPLPEPHSRQSTAERIGLSADNDRFLRTLYTVQNQLAAYTHASKLPGELQRIGMKLSGSALLAQHLRLPAGQTSFGECALFWKDFVSFIIGKPAPYLFIEPGGGPWMDLIVGAPGPRQLFCLKASSASLPCADQIPYNLTPEFRAEAARIYCAFLAEKAN